MTIPLYLARRGRDQNQGVVLAPINGLKDGCKCSQRVALNLRVEPPLEILLTPERDSIISRQIAAHGVWEPELTWLVTQLLEPSFGAIDVGANLG